MKSIFKYSEAVAGSGKPVTITGEIGVGKELIARAIHTISDRKGNFIAVNIAGLDDNFISDTLFGHIKGAFSGADHPRRGLIEEAGEGTLFLDEIGDMPEQSQVKLLRLLQEGEYFVLGSDKVKKCFAGIIAATNRDLHDKQQKGLFRKDLYYRIRTHHIHLPPLRERMEDIPCLLDHFTEIACGELKKKKPPLTLQLEQLLYTYHFPGNIRELQLMIDDAVSQYRSDMDFYSCFKNYLMKHDARRRTGVHNATHKKMMISYSGEFSSLAETEKQLIDMALHQANENKNLAARFLGISRATLFRKLQKKG